MKREQILERMEQKVRIDSNVKITVRQIDYKEIEKSRSASRASVPIHGLRMRGSKPKK